MNHREQTRPLLSASWHSTHRKPYSLSKTEQKERETRSAGPRGEEARAGWGHSPHGWGCPHLDTHKVAQSPGGRRGECPLESEAWRIRGRPKSVWPPSLQAAVLYFLSASQNSMKPAHKPSRPRAFTDHCCFFVLSQQRGDKRFLSSRLPPGSSSSPQAQTLKSSAVLHSPSPCHSPSRWRGTLDTRRWGAKMHRTAFASGGALQAGHTVV